VRSIVALKKGTKTATPVYDSFFRVAPHPGAIAKSDRADHIYGSPTNHPSERPPAFESAILANDLYRKENGAGTCYGCGGR
jgi:hypothetical protein